MLERAQVDRSGGGRVDEHGSGVSGRGLEVGHRQKRVRRRLEPHELYALRRRTGLVELDVLQAPALEDPEHRRRPEVAALGNGDRVARAEQPEHDRGRRPGAGREEERLAAVELAERLLRRDSGRMRVALVVELARLAVLVRPERRAVDRRKSHRPDCTRLLRRGRDGRIDAREARPAPEAARRGAARRDREGGRAAAGAGQAAGARAGGEAPRSRLVRRARPLRAAPKPALRDDGSPAVRGRCRDRLRDDLRPQGLRLLSGLHDLRRLSLGGVRREDLQGHGHGREVRLSA